MSPSFQQSLLSRRLFAKFKDNMATEYSAVQLTARVSQRQLYKKLARADVSYEASPALPTEDDDIGDTIEVSPRKMKAPTTATTKKPKALQKRRSASASSDSITAKRKRNVTSNDEPELASTKRAKTTPLQSGSGITQNPLSRYREDSSASWVVEGSRENRLASGGSSPLSSAPSSMALEELLEFGSTQLHAITENGDVHVGGGTSVKTDVIPETSKASQLVTQPGLQAMTGTAGATSESLEAGTQQLANLVEEVQDTTISSSMHNSPYTAINPSMVANTTPGGEVATPNVAMPSQLPTPPSSTSSNIKTSEQSPSMQAARRSRRAMKAPVRYGVLVGTPEFAWPTETVSDSNSASDEMFPAGEMMSTSKKTSTRPAPKVPRKRAAEQDQTPTKRPVGRPRKTQQSRKSSTSRQETVIKPPAVNRTPKKTITSVLVTPAEAPPENGPENTHELDTHQ